LIQLSLTIEGMQSLVCMSFVGLMLFQHFIRAGGVTGGDLLLVYWALKLPAIGQRLTALAHQYPAQRNILLRLLEPLATPEELATSNLNETSSEDNSKSNQGARIEITAGNVVVAGHSILQDINLTIAPGEHIAIVGPSGAGKSSFVGLFLGWHRLASGTVLVDGLNLNGTNQQVFRQETAWVDPAVQIWNRSFLDNLIYSAGDSGFDNIAKVIDAAALRGVLQKLPSGLQTFLGEGGALLSGGEGQRVRLGRALLQTNVRLALLDEPFRGLDRAQRHQLLNDARKWWQHATLLCVTHDVEETLSFERVLVVEDGQIIEDDAPSLLAARPSRYRELLNAEKLVRQELWKGKEWRHILVQNGLVQSTVTSTINE
jgi:ATP-binding cassette subfamily B protein